jgi:uncharacterized protein involved in outer membrane biogenesis
MRWKWIIGVTAAVVIVLLIVVYIIVASYDFNKLKPQIAKAVKDATGRELTLGGNLDLKIGFHPSLQTQNVAFQNAPWGSQPQMATVKQFEVQVSLLPLISGDIKLKRLILIEPEILIEINKAGKSNLEFEVPDTSTTQSEQTKGGAEKLPIISFEKAQIQNGILKIKDDRTNRSQTVKLVRLALEGAGFGSPADIDLEGDYNNIPFKVSGSLGSVRALMDSAKPWPIEITARAFESDVSLAGYIKDPLSLQGIDVNLKVQGENLANFEKITGNPLPVKGPFNVAGHLTAPTLENFKISDITILLGESRINGEIALNQKSPRPQINANFQFSKLDLRALIKQNNAGSKKEIKNKKSKNKSNKVFSAEPFDLQALQSVDAVLSFRADQILTHRTALDNFQLDLSLENGHLRLAPLNAGIGGGNLSGSLDLSAKGNLANLTTTIIAKKLNLGSMLKELEISETIEGILDLDIDLKGQGNSTSALMAGLNGDVIAILSEGKMPVKYINLVGVDITTSFLKLINPLEKKIARATINCVVCDFNIKNGMAKSDVLMIDDPEKTLLGTGTINLKTEELDFGIHTKPKEGIGTKDTGKISVSLSEITKPFKLGGTLANPSLGISRERTLKSIGLALLGPAGWASLFISGSSANDNPCAAAMRIAGKGTPETKTQAGSEKKQKETSKTKEEGLGSKIKGLFSKPKE